MANLEINYKEMLIKNISYIIVSYLIITLIFGALINGFIIAAYVLLIPLSVAGGIILNYQLTKKVNSQKKWFVIVGFAIGTGSINYSLLWIFMEMGFPFKLNP